MILQYQWQPKVNRDLGMDEHPSHLSLDEFHGLHIFQENIKAFMNKLKKTGSQNDLFDNYSYYFLI